MAEYEVRDVVCDYGVYEDGELKLILNSKRIALQIAELLKEDDRIHRELNPINDYPPYLDGPKHTHMIWWKLSSIREVLKDIRDILKKKGGEE